MSSRTLRYFRNRGVWSRAVKRLIAVSFAAATAVNTPGVGLEAGAEGIADIDVLDIQGQVARLERDGAYPVRFGSILDFQRILSETVGTNPGEEEASDVPAFLATLPALGRILPLNSGGYCGRLGELLAAGEEGGCTSAPAGPAPKRSVVRERYLFNLTANAPPVPPWQPS